MSDEQFLKLRALFLELEEHEKEINKIKDEINAVIYDQAWDLRKWF